MTTQNARAAVNYLVARGLSPYAAYALVGGFQQESGENLNSSIVGDGGISLGIAQWNRDRLARLKRFAGDQYRSPERQLDFVLHELQTTEAETGRRLSQANNLEDAIAAAIGYERPSGWRPDSPQSGHGYGNRRKNAYALAGTPVGDDTTFTGGSDTFALAGGSAEDKLAEIERIREQFMRARGVDPTPEPAFMSDPELEAALGSIAPGELNYDQMVEEQARRARWKDRTFVENLGDLDWRQYEAGQMGRQAVAGVSEYAALPSDVLSSVAAPIEYGLGYTDETSPVAIPASRFSETMRAMGNEGMEVGDPENVLEGAARYASMGPLGMALGGGMELFGQLDLSPDQDPEVQKRYEEENGVSLAEQLLGADKKMYDIKQPDPEPDPELSPLERLTDLFVPSAQAQGEGVPTGEPPRPELGSSDTLRNLALLSGVSAVLPHAYRLLKQGIGPKGPRIRQVETDPREQTAPARAETIETPGDLLATQTFDATAGMKNVLQRAKADPDATAELIDAIDISTHAAGRALVHNALSHGKMDTIAGSFNVPTSLSTLQQTVKRLPPQGQEAVNTYMHLWNLRDDMLRSGKRALRGKSRQQVQREIAAIETQYPFVKDIKKGYKENVDETLRFISEGPYAIFTKQEVQDLLTKSPNWTPFEVDLTVGKTFHERAALLLSNVKHKQRLQRKLSDPRHEDVPLRDPFQSLLEYQYVALQTRIENEIMGRYADLMARSKYGSNTFFPVTAKQLKQHPEWNSAGNIITIYNDGKPQKYWSSRLVADTMKFDPYYELNNVAAALYTTKRMMETGTTGYLAPWFAPVQAFRDVLIGKVTAPRGMKAPTFTGAFVAIPRQLTARLSKHVSEGIEQALMTNTGGWIVAALGQPGAKAFSQFLANSYQKSLVAAIEKSGSYNVAMTQHQISSNATAFQDALDTITNSVPGINTATVQRVKNGWKQMIDSIQNASQFSFISRNWDYSGTAAARAKNMRVIREARRLTGDYTQAGQTYVRTHEGTRKIGLDPSMTSYNKSVGTWMPRVVGPMMEAGRVVVPWFNPMLSGIRRLGQSYWNNPLTFNRRMWTGVMAPAGAIYAWNAWCGTDPEGNSYVDYAMNRRSDYDRSMNMYICVPGKPVYEGIELPMVHEFSPFFRMFHDGLDQFFRPGGQLLTPAEQMKDVWHSFANVVAAPAMPPMVSGILAASGISPPQNLAGGDTGLFGGSPRTIEQYPEGFNEEGDKFSNGTEQVFRAFGGSIIDILGSAFAAMNDAEGLDKMHAFAEGASEGLSKKAPLSALRGDKLVSSNSPIERAWREKSKALDTFIDFYREYKPDGMMNVEPASTEGRASNLMEEGRTKRQAYREAMTAPKERETVGLWKPEPTNPLYQMFSVELYKRFATDTQSDGLKGFRDLMNQMGDISEDLRRLEKVSAGNVQKWGLQPGTMKLLATAGLEPNTTTVTKVRNYLIMQRQNLRARLLLKVKQTEQDMTKYLNAQRAMAGQPPVPEVTLEMISPYGVGLEGITPQSASPQ